MNSTATTLHSIGDLVTWAQQAFDESHLGALALVMALSFYARGFYDPEFESESPVPSFRIRVTRRVSLAFLLWFAVHVLSRVNMSNAVMPTFLAVLRIGVATILVHNMFVLLLDLVMAAFNVTWKVVLLCRRTKSPQRPALSRQIPTSHRLATQEIEHESH